MALRMSKTPLAIAAIATVVALTSTATARAGGIAGGIALATAESAEVTQANFKIKKRGVHHKRGFKHRSFHRHRSFHHRSFKHRSFKHRGTVHRPKHRSRIIIKKRF